MKKSFLVPVLLACALPLFAEPEKKATEITCEGEMFFDAKEGVVVFEKNVKIVDDQFTLTTDKLTAYIKKIALDGEENDPSAGLDRVVAEGNVLISQERVDEKTGEKTLYTGKAEKAEYVAATDEVTLFGWPQITQGEKILKATREDTVMIMERSGKFRSKGPIAIQTDTQSIKKKP